MIGNVFETARSSKDDFSKNQNKKFSEISLILRRALRKLVANLWWHHSQILTKSIPLGIDDK